MGVRQTSCLLQLILFGEGSLRRALSEFVDHFHTARNHQENVFLFLRRRDRDDVWMADTGQEPGLPQQLAEIEALTMGDLDRNLLVDPGVLREVNGAESAAAERRDDLVLPQALASK